MKFQFQFYFFYIFNIFNVYFHGRLKTFLFSTHNYDGINKLGKEVHRLSQPNVKLENINLKGF